MIVRNRHFRGWHEIKLARIVELEQIGFKLWQLSGSEESIAIDDERRECFEISVLTRVHVEHEVDEGAFESRSGAVQDRETRGSDLGRAFEIEYAERIGEVDVIFRLKVKLRPRAPAANFDIR